MRYKTGLLSTLFKNSWYISTDKDYLFCKGRKKSLQIDYLDILSITNIKGIIWNTVTVTTQQFTVEWKVLSAKVANSLSKDIESNIKSIIISRVLGDTKMLSSIKLQLKKLIESDQYISQTDIRIWLSQNSNIVEVLSHPLFDPELLPEPVQSNLNLFLEITKPNSSYLQQINERFVDKSIKQYSHLFEQLENFPLSEEQMRAALINEDRNLLIAAAGSGKTSTIVAKAIYLVSAGLAKPEEILILAYNKDAQIELENRFRQLIGIVPQYNEALNVKTFHSYGYEILSEFENGRPKISEFASAGRKRQSHLFTNLIKHLYDNDPIFRVGWREFLLMGKFPIPDLFKVKSKRQYDDLLLELGAIRRNLPEGRQLMIPTIDGKEVRSFEEARIANWLALNGVVYEYERQYINPNNPNEKLDYNPDFYYPEVDLYHEHFAINSEGKIPPFIGDDYLKKVDWKRKTHKKNHTKLIETH